jgi:hypothetical protein
MIIKPRDKLRKCRTASPEEQITRSDVRSGHFTLPTFPMLLSDACGAATRRAPARNAIVVDLLSSFTTREMVIAHPPQTRWTREARTTACQDKGNHEVTQARDLAAIWKYGSPSFSENKPFLAASEMYE